MSAFTAWLSAFSVTEIVEVPIYALGLAACAVPQAGRFIVTRRVAIAFGASLLTHPIVWFVIPRLWRGHSYLSMCIAAELFAFLAEAFYFERFGLARPFRWSLLANASSVAVGLALRSSFGWP